MADPRGHAIRDARNETDNLRLDAGIVIHQVAVGVTAAALAAGSEGHQARITEVETFRVVVRGALPLARS